jgi:hypothetical protein
MGGETAPLYVVCSPGRSGGRTLVSRLLTEFYVLGDRPVAAFDLCDDEPQLADYLPHLTTIADITDIRDQIRFFERLVADDDGPKIIDVNHRAFKIFFTTIKKIGFFDEARRHSIVPLILLAGDAHPKSLEMCATIRRWFPDVFLLPVRDVTETIAFSGPDMPAKERIARNSLDVPPLRSSLRMLIDVQDFSFYKFWRAKPANLPDAWDNELLDWLTTVFFEIQDIEVLLGFEENWTQIAAPPSRRVGIAHQARQRDVQPPDRGQFAPKKARGDTAMDQPDQYPITKLQKMTVQLQSAEERINAFESAIKQWQDRATQAETKLLKLIQSKIEHR